MNKKYNPKKIELLVQKHWEKNNTFSVTEKSKKKKYYCLPMLPYPSGDLHMGHVRNYTISDVISRYQRMLGKNVLQPIGWDAFGLPAEEAAIKNNIEPSKWTYSNINIMKKQLKSLGFSYDWNREITTCQPEYYKWEQWFFIKLYKKKLVYKKNTLVNWCIYDKTVLANEQVHNGKCWRCNTPIILKKIPQWFIKITKYAEELLKDLKKLKKWPKKVLQMQKNWIGKTEGLKIKCKIYNSIYTLTIYTTKPENIIETTFFAISIYHPIVSKLLKKNIKIKNFIKKYKNILYQYKKEKYIGINTDIFVIHPLTFKKIPLWIALYIKHDYATGAIMGVPNHNKEDFCFASFHKIPIKNIFLYKYSNKKKKTYLTSECINLINLNLFNKINTKKSLYPLSKLLIHKKIAKKCIFYKLKDWSISRQRYWGTPIPMTTDKNGNIIPVPKKKLPVILPINIKQKKYNKNLSEYKKWLNTKINGKYVTRETDTFDTFMESSWYYARYTNTNFIKGIVDPVTSKYWLPIDQYVGGIEHAVMHLIYFRFYHKLLRDFGFVTSDEPVKKLICQGMVLADAFFIYNKNKTKTWINPLKINITYKKTGKIKYVSNLINGKKVLYAGKIKMSKSKNNGINPSLIINKYGADTLRLFLMFSAPIETSLEWNENNIIGMYRFLKKLWKFSILLNLKDIIKPKNIKKDLTDKKIFIYLNHTIKYVTDDIHRRNSYNTAISHIMKFFNKVIKLPHNSKIEKFIIKKSLKNIIKLLYPFTPHICFILWKEINSEKSDIDKELWPIVNNKKNINQYFKIIIQINGKKKIILKKLKNLKKDQIIKMALKEEKIKKNLKNKKIKKIIYIHQKVINFVIK